MKKDRNRKVSIVIVKKRDREKSFDFISLCETWVEEKGKGERIDCRAHMFKYIALRGERERRKGRARGGFLINKRKKKLEGRITSWGVLVSKIMKGRIR